MEDKKNILYITGFVIIIILLGIYFLLAGDNYKYSGGVDPNIDWNEPTEPPPSGSVDRSSPPEDEEDADNLGTPNDEEEVDNSAAPDDEWVEPTEPPPTP